MYDVFVECFSICKHKVNWVLLPISDCVIDCIVNEKYTHTKTPDSPVISHKLNAKMINRQKIKLLNFNLERCESLRAPLININNAFFSSQMKYLFEKKHVKRAFLLTAKPTVSQVKMMKLSRKQINTANMFSLQFSFSALLNLRF